MTCSTAASAPESTTDVRAVDRGDPDLLPALQQRCDLVLGRLHRHHRAAGRQRLHQPATRRDQLRRVRQRQHPRHMGSGHLTDGVTQQDSPASHPSDSSSRNSATSTANNAGCAYCVWSRSSSAPAQTTSARGRQQAVQLRTHLVPGPREHREGVVQSRPMPSRWRPGP